MFDAGRETEVQCGGKTFLVGRMELDVLEGWFLWLRERTGDPFADLERVIDRVPPAAAVTLVKEAEAKRDALRALDLGDPWIQTQLRGLAGSVEMVRLLLKARHPDATAKDAFAVMLAAKARGGGLDAVLRRSMGDVEDAGGNAAGAPAGAPTGASSTVA